MFALQFLRRDIGTRSLPEVARAEIISLERGVECRAMARFALSRGSGEPGRLSLVSTQVQKLLQENL